MFIGIRMDKQIVVYLHNGWICQASVCSSVLSHHKKDLEWRTLKPLAGHSSRVLDRPCYNSQVSNRLCYTSWTNQHYSSILFRKWQENSSSRREGMLTQSHEEDTLARARRWWGGGGEWGIERKRKSAHTWERERKRFGSSFYVFSSPWACPMQIGLSQECCFFYLRSSLRSSDLPLTFLCSIFEGFSLPGLLATAILNSFSLF